MSFDKPKPVPFFFTSVQIILASLILFSVTHAAAESTDSISNAIAARATVSAEVSNLPALADPVAIGNPGEKPDTFDLSPFFSDSHLKLTLRNYSESLQLAGYVKRNAWIQGGKLAWESGFSAGSIGLGLDASLYGAVKLGGGDDVHNLAHAGPDGSSRATKAWAYPGEYAIKARTQTIDVKYGLLSFNGNPYLDPYDNRTHPPTFRGLSIIVKPAQELTIRAGSVNAVVARGADFFQSLTTITGATPFKRQTFLGGEWEDKSERKLVLYLSRSQDLWDQSYASASRSFGDLTEIKWTVKADMYYGTEQGAKLQGAVNNKAYSSSISAQHKSSLLLVGIQQIASDQFFDYTKETAGEFLDNSMGVDYNAPHEKSLQVRYKYNGKFGGIAGFEFTAWGVRGYAVDARVEASRHQQINDPLHGLYWSGGKPVSGGHHEVGTRITYFIQAGPLKNMRASLFAIKHKMDSYYPSIDFVDYSLRLELPIKFF